MTLKILTETSSSFLFLDNSIPLIETEDFPRKGVGRYRCIAWLLGLPVTLKS